MFTKRRAVLIAALAAAWFMSMSATAVASSDTHGSGHGESHGEGHGGEHGFHFTKPLVTIYPNVATEIEAKYLYLKKSFVEEVHHEDVDESIHEIELELAYAITDWIGVEMKLPFETFSETEAGHTETESSFSNLVIGTKLQSNAFVEKHKVLIAGGIGVEFPTGNSDKHIGSSETYSLEPFYSIGWKPADMLQLITSGKFGLPLNTDDESEFAFAIAAVILFSDDLRALIELDGEVVLDGHESGETILNLTPGVRYRLPFGLDLGLGVGFPITSGEELEVRVISSLLYEF